MTRQILVYRKNAKQISVFENDLSNVYKVRVPPIGRTDYTCKLDGRRKKLID